MGWLSRLKNFFTQGSIGVPSARRLDGRGKTLLAASIKVLPYEEPGWITSKEAWQLFSPTDDQYAFGEMDEIEKRNLAAFAWEVTAGCLFEFMPAEGSFVVSVSHGGSTAEWKCLLCAIAG
jgi:hypothetical protein